MSELEQELDGSDEFEREVGLHRHTGIRRRHRPGGRGSWRRSGRGGSIDRGWYAKEMSARSKCRRPMRGELWLG